MLTPEQVNEIYVKTKEDWNLRSDKLNQWDDLGRDEQNELFAAAIEQAAAREAIEMLRTIPTTPEQMIAFIGSNFGSMGPVGEDGKPMGDPSDVAYSLTVHDLLSAFAWIGLDANSINADIRAIRSTDTGASNGQDA